MRKPRCEQRGAVLGGPAGLTRMGRPAHRGHVLMGCPTYLGGHVHTGCRLDDLTLLPYHMHVTVTGSSRTGDVMFYDTTLNTKLIGG